MAWNLLATFALQAGSSIFNRAMSNDAANRQKESLRRIDKLKFQQERSKYLNEFNQATEQVHFYNQALVAQHNARVNQYNMNVAQLADEETRAYNDAQMQANGEVAEFMEENIDLLKNYVQQSGTLAAKGINSASAKLAEMKNMEGGFLDARRRTRTGALNDLGQVVRTIEKIEYVGNAQRDAWYAAVKDKPTLRPYPRMGALPSYKTPSHLKNNRLGFKDIAPDLVKAGVATATPYLMKDVFGGAGGATEQITEQAGAGIDINSAAADQALEGFDAYSTMKSLVP